MASADFIDWFFHSKNTSVRQKREAVGGTSSPTWTKAARSQLLQMIGPVTRSCLLLCSWKVWTHCRYSRALKPSVKQNIYMNEETSLSSPHLSVLVLSAHEHEELTAWGSSVAVCIQVDELLAVVTCQLQFDSHTLPVYTEGGGWSRKLEAELQHAFSGHLFISYNNTIWKKKTAPWWWKVWLRFSLYQEILHYLNNYFWLLMQ